MGGTAVGQTPRARVLPCHRTKRCHDVKCSNVFYLLLCVLQTATRRAEQAERRLTELEMRVRLGLPGGGSGSGGSDRMRTPSSILLRDENSHHRGDDRVSSTAATTCRPRTNDDDDAHRRKD